MENNSGKRDILIIRLSALGDVAMTIPVIYSFARIYPSLRITVLTRPFFARLFIDRPGNVNVMEADTKGEYRGIRGMALLLRRLSGMHFDYVADLHNVLRAWEIDLAMLLSGAKVAMVDKGRAGRRRLTSGRKAGEKPAAQQDYVSRYADVFARLGYPVKISFRSVFESRIPEPPVQVRPGSVGIAPFARYANKTYPPEKMERVVRMLSAEGIPVYLFGGRGAEQEMLGRWERTVPNCISLAGKFAIEQELAVIARLRLMVTMDSANQHLASLVGTEAVTVWGSTVPECGFLGYSQLYGDAVFAGLPCQPCTIAGSRKCRIGGMPCLNSIEPETVARKIMDRL